MDYLGMELGIRHTLLVILFVGNFTTFSCYILTKISKDNDVANRIGWTLRTSPVTFIGAVAMLVLATPFFFAFLWRKYTAPKQQLYRYTINEGDCGGCVLACSEEEGVQKVQNAYLAYMDKADSPEDARIAEKYANSEITVWIDDEHMINKVSSDMVEVY